LKIKIDEIKELAIKVAEKNGLTREQAEIIVAEYLDGQLRGRKCHGFSAFPKFAVKKLKTFGTPHEILKNEDCYMLVNGNGSMGQIVLNDVFPKLMEKAKDKGIAMLGMFNMHSYLMPGTYARQAANNDLIALMFNYGGAPRICATGSIDPMFATNPIAVGIPSNDFPIVVDMATSKTAMGKVRLAKKLGLQIDEDCAIDKEGKSTTDPEAAMQGALLPFGGYKGYVLALTVEVLSRSMYGIPLDENVIGKRGFTFILLDPSKFGDLNEFKANISDLIKQIKSSRKAEGVEEIFVPGERSERIKQENLKKGFIEIENKIVDDIKKLLE